MNKTVKCKLRILRKPAIIKYVNINIVYVFNLTLLINVFATDLR